MSGHAIGAIAAILGTACSAERGAIRAPEGATAVPVKKPLAGAHTASIHVGSTVAILMVVAGLPGGPLVGRGQVDPTGPGTGRHSRHAQAGTAQDPAQVD